ncbi:hypothetical protein BDQ17DRAFT_1361097 [Cyathus striatus]|nr:hypothetical protein BDQ17DRAFT_1361097 [Cyathus striatus]
MPTPQADKNPIVSLETNSLYIATSQRMAAQGTFHWAVVITDNVGKATRIHWTLIKTRDINSPAEGLVSIPDYSASTYSRGNTATFAFFKIAGYDAVAGEDWDVVWDCANTVFPEGLREGFKTVKENRKNGVRCRTWALGFLRRLVESGILHRSVEEVQGFEKLVVDTSIVIEENADEFTASKMYTI